MCQIIQDRTRLKAPFRLIHRDSGPFGNLMEFEQKDSESDPLTCATHHQMKSFVRAKIE
jgi:hypothetical protein